MREMIKNEKQIRNLPGFTLIVKCPINGLALHFWVRVMCCIAMILAVKGVWISTVT